MHRIPSQFSKELTGQKFIAFFKESEGQVIIDEGKQRKRKVCVYLIYGNLPFALGTQPRPMNIKILDSQYILSEQYFHQLSRIRI